jgi:hypothetical protein
MRHGHARILLIGATLLAAAGCASGDEWRTWKDHPTHFASGDHLSFSARNNRDGSNPRVKRKDVVLAGEQGWWGRPIAVSQSEILER